MNDENTHDRHDIIRAHIEKLRERVFDYDQMQALAEPQTLVQHLIIEGTLGTIYGPSGSGKSLIGLDLAASIASPHIDWWHGNRIEHRKVLYIAGEGFVGYAKRARAWQLHHATRFEAHLFRGAINLSSQVEMEALANMMLDQNYKVVFIDTLARSLMGVEENSASEMSQIVARLDLLRLYTGATVILVHHTGKDTTAGMRGSSAIKGAIDWELEVVGTPRSLELKNTKQKDMPESDSIHMSWCDVPDTGSGVLIGGFSDDVQGQRIEALEVLESIQPASKVPVTSTIWKDACIEQMGVSKTTFFRLARALLDANLVDRTGGDVRGSYAVSVVGLNKLRSMEK